MPLLPMTRMRWSYGAPILQVIRAVTPQWKSRQATEKSGVSAGQSGAGVLSGRVTLENAVTVRTGPNIEHSAVSWYPACSYVQPCWYSSRCGHGAPVGLRHRSGAMG